MGKGLSSKHRGEILEKTIRQSGVSVTEVARRLGIARKTLYNYFEEELLSWDKIIEIYKAFDWDVYQDFPEAPGTMEMQEPEADYGNQKLHECEEELKNLYRKYIKVLEENSQLKDRLRKLGY